MNPAPVVIESAVSVTKSNTPPKNVFTTKNAWKFKVALVMLAVVFLYFTIMKMNKKKKASLIVTTAAPADGKANNDSRPPPEKVQ
jgi:hypothetical protein